MIFSEFSKYRCKQKSLIFFSKRDSFDFSSDLDFRGKIRAAYVFSIILGRRKTKNAILWNTLP